MILQTEKQKVYTPQEYLELEIEAKDRHEYRKGEIVIMPVSKTESGQWLLSDYDGQEATITLQSVSLEIPLSDIYDKVNFQNKNQ